VAPVTFPARSRHRIIACPCWKSANYNAERWYCLSRFLSTEPLALCTRLTSHIQGGKLGAFRTELQPGMIVSLQRGAQKAKFRIAWIRQIAPKELQAGVESLEPLTIFGV
jgi:hypothetical protein